MRKEDFYTGEVLTNTSPPISSQNELEATQMASFGKYDYDPGMRLMSQPTQIYPGAYGYNTNPNPALYYGSPQVGLGANPYGYNTWQNNFNYGYYQNPYYYNGYNYIDQQRGYQPPAPPTQYFIKPVNFSGEFLPPADFEDQIQQWKMDFWTKEQEQSAKDSVDRKNIGYGNPYYYGTNYYGVPYYNPYQYNSCNAEAARLVHEMEEEARQNRLNLNMKLSRLAHNIAGDDYKDEWIRERYEGKYVDIPESQRMDYSQMVVCNRFANLVPFDNSSYYRERDAEVSREYNSIIPKDSNMQECFANSGIVRAKYELQEEAHRRKNGAMLYNSEDNSYKYFVRAKAAERYAAQKGGVVPNNDSIYNPMNQMYSNPGFGQFPTLSQSAKLCDDGTLNITCNFGSRAGQVYSVHNSQEASYEQDRERFKGFIDSIPGSIYLTNPNGGK